MSKPVLVLLPFLALCSGLLWAQEAPIPPPTPPFVKTPPPGSAWTVQIEPTKASNPKTDKAAASPASGAAAEPKKLPEMPVQLAVKSGLNGVIMGQISYNDDRQETYYVSDGSLVLLAENTRKAFARSLRMSEDDACSLEVAHFPGTSWIAQENYKGTGKKDGIACWHYAMSLPMGLDLDAWIRSDTSYPAEVDLKSPEAGSYTYHFEPVTAFPQDIPLPDIYRDVLSELKVKRSALDALRKANQAQQ
jgi:hypothetical protein